MNLSIDIDNQIKWIADSGIIFWVYFAQELNYEKLHAIIINGCILATSFMNSDSEYYGFEF